jgi:hypothetical protein
MEENPSCPSPDREDTRSWEVAKQLFVDKFKTIKEATGRDDVPAFAALTAELASEKDRRTATEEILIFRRKPP